MDDGMGTGDAWGRLLRMMRGVDDGGGDTTGAALALARDGGRLARGMDMVAGALSGIAAAPHPDTLRAVRLFSIAVCAPVWMDRYGTVPDDPARIATMAVFSGMSLAVPGSSARGPDAHCMLPSGKGVSWGYDGPDVTPGFMESLVSGHWPEKLAWYGVRTDGRHPAPPAFPVELVACMTGGEAPGPEDVRHAADMQSGSDLSPDGGAPCASLPMDADTLGGTSGLRARMGDAWPVMGMLRADPYSSAVFPSMADVRFLVRDMDWARPADTYSPGRALGDFIDVVEGMGTGGGTGGRYEMINGRDLVAWASSLHDQVVMAAVPSAAMCAERLSRIFSDAVSGVIGSRLAEGGDVGSIPVPTMGMVRKAASMTDMPDRFLRETVRGMIDGGMAG